MAKQFNEEVLKQYLGDRALELQRYANDGSAFFFLLAAAFIDFLACAASNKKSDGHQFKNFINTNWPDATDEYADAI